MKLAEIVSATLRLKRSQRLRLIQELDASLMTAEEREIEEAWLDEVERRYAEWKAGNAKTIPSEEVFRQLRAKYAAPRS